MSDESVMRKYLLGDLPAEERTRVEDEYFADADRFEELVGAENDLIDAYVRGTLSDSERRQFEQHYANRPERRGRIDFAKALAQAALQGREPLSGHKGSPWSSLLSYRIPRPHLQWALVSGAVFLVGILLELQNYRLLKELQGAQASVSQLRRQDDALRQQIAGLSVQSQQGPERESNNEVAQLEPSADLAFRLEPHEREVDFQRDLVIPQNRSWVRLEMVLERDEFKTYEAVLMPPEHNNRAILRGKGLHSHSIGGIPVVAWRFRSNSMQSSDYIVELSGETATGRLEPVKSYSFRAVRE
jgi:hypothetical protein